MRLIAVLVASAIAATLSAQSTIVIPNGMATAEGSTANAFPMGRGGTGLRHQAVYDSSHFTNQGITQPILITGLKWRPNSNVALVASNYTTGVTVSCSTCPVDQSAVTTTFTNQQGADLATCYSGVVSWVAQPAQPGPTPFGISVPFTTNFLYDATLGDLCVESDLPIQTFTGTGPQLDVHAAAPLASRVFLSTNYVNGGPNAIATGITLNHGVVIEVSYVPANGLLAAFTATPTTGALPLTVNFTDTSYTSGPGPVTSWAWDLDGDSVVDSTTQHPAFVYTTCGDYNVTLTVTDASHPPTTLTRTAFIRAGNDAWPSFTSTALAPGVYQFTDTTAPAATSWAWDLDGDGITDSTVQNPVWVYSQVCIGVNVRLTVMRACRGPFTVTNIIALVPNTATCATTGGAATSSTAVLGNLFDVQVNHPHGVNVCAISSRPYSFTGPFNISVYVTPGSYVGKHNTASAWRLLGTGVGMTPGGTATTSVPVVVPLNGFGYLPAGSHGLAVYLQNPAGSSFLVSSGGSVGPFGNADVTLIPSPATAPGIISIGVFGTGMAATRAWNGALHYSTSTNGGDAGFGFFGAGCPGSLGVTHQLHTNRPRLGTTLSVNLDNLPLSIAVLMLGFSRTASPFGALPVDLTPFGAPGCLGRVSPDATTFLIGSGTAATWLFGIPPDPALLAVQFYSQALVLDPGWNALGAAASDAAALLLGY